MPQRVKEIRQKEKKKEEEKKKNKERGLSKCDRKEVYQKGGDKKRRRM